MTFTKQFHVLLIIFFFFPFLNASHPNPCYTSYCGTGQVNVRFPFWLSPKQHEYCGHPGFNLVCAEDYKGTTLKLPNSEPFFVQEIDYERQRLRLSDPGNCLARKFLNFDISESPFSPFLLLNYTFVICPKDEKITSFKSIPCLGNSTASFFVTESKKISLMPSACRIFKTLPLPISGFLSYTRFPSNLNNEDMWLKWDSPDCKYCERRTDSRCGFVDSSTLQVQCLSSVYSGLHSTGLQVLKILCLSLIGPLIALSFCVGLVMCSPDRVSSQIQQAMVSRLSGSVTPQPSEEVIVSTGLDESTIESYKKVELGESRRLPTGADDTLCSICLSEYATKESVRCLPECEHCFHLSMRGSSCIVLVLFVEVILLQLVKGATNEALFVD